MVQRLEEEFEILVINSSDDETPQMVKEQFPTVRLIQLEKRAFAATARNIGIQRARGDILAFIDADCIPEADWLKGLASWHQKEYRAVGGSIVNASRKNIYSKAEYPLELMEFSPDNTTREVKFVSAANCLFARGIFDKYGLFPDIRAGEDVLFCHRISKGGEGIIFDHNIRVFHKNDITLKAYLKKQIMHGRHSYEIRQMAELSGSFLNNPFFFPLLVPFLPFVRTARVVFRSLSLKNNLIYDILSAFPHFLLGCVMWSFGYVKSYADQFSGKISFPKKDDRML
jgi:GT2 family glycosyltransferase